MKLFIFHVVWIRVYYLGVGCLFRLFSLVVAGRRFLHHESERPDPIKKSWECPKSRPAPCSSLHTASQQQSVHKHVTWGSKCFRSRSPVSASVSTFPPFYHMCSRGNNTGLCCSLFTAEGMLFRPSVCVCNRTAREKTEKKGSESQCVRGFEGWSQRAYFGVPDESPEGCGCTLSACSTSSCFLFTISQMVERQKFLKPLRWLGLRWVCVFRLTSLISLPNTL